MSDLIERDKTIDTLQMDISIIPYAKAREYANAVIETIHNRLEQLPSAQPEKCSDILEELKADDYYNYIHTGHSRFSEDDWDYLIHNAKEKEKLHERLNIKTDGC